MKLMRYGAKGSERPGLIDAQGKVRDAVERDGRHRRPTRCRRRALASLRDDRPGDAAGGGAARPHRAAVERHAASSSASA